MSKQVEMKPPKGKGDVPIFVNPEKVEEMTKKGWRESETKESKSSEVEENGES